MSHKKKENPKKTTMVFLYIKYSKFCSKSHWNILLNEALLFLKSGALFLKSQDWFCDYTFDEGNWSMHLYFDGKAKKCMEVAIY